MLEQVEWIEPMAAGGTQYVRCSIQDAINHQREEGKRNGYVYKSDDAALNDFMLVNMAERVQLGRLPDLLAALREAAPTLWQVGIDTDGGTDDKFIAMLSAFERQMEGEK